MSKSIEDRLEKLEVRHDSGGICEENRVEVWKEIGKLRERMISLETKLLIGGGALSILGPIVAQYLFNLMTEKK